MRMALSTGSFYPYLTTLEGCQAAAEAGFSWVEIVLQGHEEHSLSFAHQLARLCANLKVKPVALHPRAEFFQTSDYRDAANCPLFQQMVDFAGLIQSPLMVFHGPGRNSDIEVNCEVTHGLLHMAKAARQKGIRFTLENSPSGFCQSPAEFKEIIACDLDHDLWITLDGYKAAASGYSHEEFLHTLPGRIGHFHYCDSLNRSGKRLLPGYGNAPLDLILGALHTAMPNGACVLEAQEIQDAVLLRSLPEKCKTWDD